MTGTTLDNIFNSKPASFIDLAVLVSISRHGNARYGCVVVMISINTEAAAAGWRLYAWVRRGKDGKRPNLLGCPSTRSDGLIDVPCRHTSLSDALPDGFRVGTDPKRGKIAVV